MTVDCQWVEKNLEALFCDRLSQEQDRLAQAHIRNCDSCNKQVQALNAIDPLVKHYFRQELEIAGRPRVLHSGRIVSVSGAAAAVFVILFLLIRTPQTAPVIAPAADAPNATTVVSAESPGPIKRDEAGELQRAKPSAEPSAPALDRRPVVPPAIRSDAPDFLVTDPAGYSHKLDEYRRHVVVIGVWSADETESISNIERLYKAYGANPKFRFLGITNHYQAKPANTTFPVLYNQGSRLFGAKPGEFVLVDENGAVELRGSLVKDFDSLTKILRGK